MGAGIYSLVRSRASRVGIGAITIVFLGFYISTVIRVWRADWLADRQDQPSLEASALTMPWNADTWWLLGRYFLYGAQDSHQAVAKLDQAVELNPYEARYWLDLAEAYQFDGEASESQKALARALQAEPTSPSIAWKVANLYLARNETGRALPLLRTALRYDPAATVSALDLCWRVTRNVNQMVREVLPAEPSLYFALLKILTAQSQSAPANQLWADLMAQKLTFPIEAAFPYFDYLIQTNQIDQAVRVWADLRKLDSAPSNLVRNGGFEAEFLNGGFEWRYNRVAQVDVALDTSHVHSGIRSLRLEFAGPAVSDAGVYEYVPVQPNTGYRLSAFGKTEDINTASGPRVAVEDSAAKRLLATTDEFQDTFSWRRRTAEFTTGPDTHLVTIRIVRTPGNLLIKGTLWLDDIELAPDSLAQRGAP